jgi:peroxiredoxin Q/BCP
MTIKEGSSAPDFTLADQDNAMRTLSDYRGKWVLLYFYPKDDTPGCTKEACMIRDAFPDFGALGITVLGVSTDSAASHKKFSEKYGLPFTLLADTEKKAVQAYGVWGKKKFMGREYEGTLRTSFLIDPRGIVAKVYENVKPEVHAGEVLADLAALKEKGGIS